MVPTGGAGLRPGLTLSGALEPLPPPVGPESLGPLDTPRPAAQESGCHCAEHQNDRWFVRVLGEDRETRSLLGVQASGPVCSDSLGCRVALAVGGRSEGVALSPKAQRFENMGRSGAL